MYSNIEYHLLGNHLFANAKALIFSGYYLDGLEPKKWLRKGLYLLDLQIDEQIKEDGGHFENSPMYHNIILEDILDIINLLEDQKNQYKTLKKLKKIAQKMILWMDGLTHDDGEVSFFNDAATGIACKNKEIKRYANCLKINYSDLKKHNNDNSLNYYNFKNSGYVRLEALGASAILDLAELGPIYLPGHGHADTLSFELSINSYRFIVNAGTYGYEYNKNRVWERSTAAHSTVEINGENSSEVWKSFRVGIRAVPRGIQIQKKEKVYFS